MATGSGKTYTAITTIYRLLRFAGARRVLFLVDRGNLGVGAMREFNDYVAPDDGRKFTELYNVQRMQNNRFDVGHLFRPAVGGEFEGRVLVQLFSQLGLAAEHRVHALDRADGDP